MRRPRSRTSSSGRTRASTPSAIVSAGLDTLAGRPRGASTITQQLVRARLLPPRPSPSSTYERKVREIIQSIRLTEAYPGDKGKQDIITAYLNQNFYGNQTYGVKAAARGYFGKSLKELTLAAVRDPRRDPPVADASSTSCATPRRSASTRTRPTPTRDEVCKKIQLEVPPTSEIVQRRNYILDLMKTRSPLSGSQAHAAEYDAAKVEPVVIKPQASATWRAAQFVWQVREELARDRSAPTTRPTARRSTPAAIASRPRSTGTCRRSPRSGPTSPRARRIRATHGRSCAATKIPAREWGWILNLRGRNIHNAASAVMDYRTGEVLAYVGSARYTARATRSSSRSSTSCPTAGASPGSSIKPIDYAIGIDDETLHRKHDVDGRRDRLRAGLHPDPGRQARARPGPGAQRPPVLAEHPGHQGHAHAGPASTRSSGARTSGSSSRRASARSPRWVSGRSRPIRSTCCRRTARSANRGVKMPRQLITKVVDENGRQVWPLDDTKPEGAEVVSPQAAYIITDILAGNTSPERQPVLGRVGDLRKERPATAGRLQDRYDERQPRRPRLRLPRPAGQQERSPPSPSASGWATATTSRTTAACRSIRRRRCGRRSSRTSAPRYPIASFKAPGGLQTATVDAFTGLKPGPYTKKTVKELFIKGTVPTQRETLRVSREIDEASGLALA